MTTETLNVFREPDGKLSFGRMFGASAMASVLAGWWLSLLFGTVLPELTNEILMIALAPYGIGKVAGAWGRQKEAT